MPGLDVIVVGVIVAGAMVWAARGIWRAARREKTGCADCASDGGCPAQDPETGAPKTDCGTSFVSLDPPEGRS